MFAQAIHPAHPRRAALGLLATVLFTLGCPPQPPADNSNDNAGGDPSANAAWALAFDASVTGALSSVWGSSASDVFVVGGSPGAGEIYHFDGSSWSEMEVPANVSLLVWVYGFSSDQVFAVGEDGSAVRYDGVAWTKLETGTTEDLWGIWGAAPDEMWVVGGSIGEGDPALLRFNADDDSFTPVAVPANDRNATSLFKVWGIGSKVFAVGERGLIIEYDGSTWAQVPTGADADEDFVSLWGTSEDNIVAVGGRSSARISVYDGTSWNTTKPAGVPGLNAVFMAEPGLAVVGGTNGYCGAFNPETLELTAESAPTNQTVHALWASSAARFFGVGGRFSAPYTGLALVRVLGDTTGYPQTLHLLTPDNNDNENSNDNANANDNGSQQDITDCNGNGIDDAVDLANGAADCDDNGVPDACQSDSDGDGAIDVCEFCDNDPAKISPGTCGCGVADTDSDSDGTADCLDGCNDLIDSDGDGVVNCIDGCPNDALKTEPGVCGCGVADDDSDGDGIKDCNDTCDDRIDSDGDGVSDCVDVCVGNDASGDSDADGVCDSNDLCPGSDDFADADTDGIPDGCDPCPNDPTNTCCTHETDCDLGFNCVAGQCTAAAEEDLELGTGSNAGSYAKLAVGDTYYMQAGFQGLIDAYISFRVTGFAPGATVDVATSIRIVENNQLIHQTLLPRALLDAGGGINQYFDFYMFVFVPPSQVDGKVVRISLTVTDQTDPNISASQTIDVVADVLP